MSTQTSYKTFWDDKASTTQGALLAVDGSANEQVLQLTGAYSARQVATALDLRTSDRVLELGCGVGRIGHLLAPKVAHWEGADISANMLKVARQRLAEHRNVGFTELVRTSLAPLPDASFDKAYCVAVFIHMDKEDFYLYLEELARVVKPGGQIYFDTWNLASPVGWRRSADSPARVRDAARATPPAAAAPGVRRRPARRVRARSREPFRAYGIATRPAVRYARASSCPRVT